MAKVEEHRIDQFFSGPGARADDWRGLLEAAKAWTSGSSDRAKFEAKLSEIAISEEYHAYPGPRLMAAQAQPSRRPRAADFELLAGRPVLPRGYGRPLAALQRLDQVGTVVPHGIDGH